MVGMQSARLKRAGVARHLLETRGFSRVRLHFVSGQFAIDAKSIVGIMALDISHPIKMQITGFDEDINKILEEIEPYIVNK